MAEQIVDTYKGPFWRSNGAIFIVIKSFLGRRLLDVNMRSFMESPCSRWVKEMGMRYPTLAGDDIRCRYIFTFVSPLSRR